MANQRIALMDLQQLVQLKAKGRSNRSISESIGISRNTVNDYVKLFKSLNQSFEDLAALDLNALKKLLAELKPEAEHTVDSRYPAFQKQLGYYLKELKRPGATYQTLWYQYREQHPDGYGYTQFKYHLQGHRRKSEVYLPMTHKYGDKLFIDFTGKKLEVIDRSSGEVQLMEVFVGILGASQYTYVEAVPSQSLPHFISCTANCLAFMGGVPQALVPDNLKAAVEKASNYEAVINRQYKLMAAHYQTVVYPTRVAKPKDKPLVENAVRLVYQRIFYPMRNMVFFSLAELNQQIVQLLDAHNRQQMQGRGYSRWEQFTKHEKALLNPLPKYRYETKQNKRAMVQKNSHVWLEKHYYSVHHSYVGQRVQILYNELSVEIYAHQERIAIHKRSQQPHSYTTIKEHMPSTHQFVMDWHPDRFIKWANKIGPNCGQYVQQVLEHYGYPEQAYKSCIGIINLGKKYSNERLEKACQRALLYEKYSYRTIEYILLRKLDQLNEQEIESQQLVLPLHDNIRGAEYYE